MTDIPMVYEASPIQTKPTSIEEAPRNSLPHMAMRDFVSESLVKRVQHGTSVPSPSSWKTPQYGDFR